MGNRSTAARIGALERWSKQDPVAGTAKARATFASKFRDQVIAEANARNEILSEEEIEKRAERLRKAYYLRLSLRSAKVRAARKKQSK